MYTDFTVEGFRGLGRLHLPRLTPVTLITGRNDVGKSALLEAMFLHGCGPTAAFAGLDVLRPMRRLQVVSREAEGRLNDPWAPFFAGMRADRPITLRATVAGTERQVEMHPSAPSQGKIAVGSPAAQFQTTASLRMLTQVDGQPAVEYQQSVTLDGAGQVASLGSEPGPVSSWSEARIVKGVGAVDVAQAYSTLRHSGRDDDLLAGLRAVDPRITGVELLVSEGGLALHARMAGGDLMPPPWVTG